MTHIRKTPFAPIVLAAMAILMASATYSAAEDSAKPDALVAKARTAIKGLGGNLKAELMGAMKKGGPVAAIDVCKTVAPSIAASQSQAHGLKISRTALKLRNPANKPDEFERRVMEDFVSKIDAGADPKTLDHAETVMQADGTKVFRYMKAIPTAEKPCLACHGESIAPEVKAEIDKRYPEDQATGFKAGQLRGAFTVTQALK